MSESGVSIPENMVEKYPIYRAEEYESPLRSVKLLLDFEPIEIQGEPISVTILRDRGPH